MAAPAAEASSFDEPPGFVTPGLVTVGEETVEAACPPLPEGWKECQDVRGLTFYLNQADGRTSWTLPTAAEAAGAAGAAEATEAAGAAGVAEAAGAAGAPKGMRLRRRW